MASDVKQTMIERTAVLLAKKGLDGTSFSDVLDASGAPRGSLYHHFPGGKDELVLAAIDFAGGQALGFLKTLSGKPAVEIAEAFVGLWRFVLERSAFAAGCAVVAVTVAAEKPALLDRTAQVFRTWRTSLAVLLEDGGVSAERAPGLAATLISALEGAVVMARADRSFEVFELVAKEQVATVGQAVEAARARQD